MNLRPNRSDPRRAASGALAAAFWLLLLPAVGWAADAPGPGVEGRLVVAGEPVSGGRVSAYRTIDFGSEPAAISSPSSPDGRYRLDLEPGTYYLTAAAEGRWAWCGQNPVSVGGGVRPWIGFSLTAWTAPVLRAAGGDLTEGRITGRVLWEGEPLEDATVSLYFDETEGFRGMGFMRSPPTGSDGFFALDMVPEGRYYLIARKRGSGLGVGPMVKGDLISYYRFNPVRVVEGKEMEVLLPMVSKRLERELHGVGEEAGLPGFEGVITDGRGRPVEGVHVFAYLEPEMGHHKPAALSSVTDENGRYRIFLPEGGKYYVGARQGYGDNPSPGELFGHYEGTPDHSLVIDKGDYRKGVDMEVRKVLAP